MKYPKEPPVIRRPEDAPLVTRGAMLNDGCCEAVTMAVFRGEDLAGLYRRHTGGLCAGIVNEISYRDWRYHDRILPA